MMHFIELTMKGLLLWYFQGFIIGVLGCTGLIWKEYTETGNSDVCTVKCTKDPANLPFDCQFSPELCQATVCKTHCINGSQPSQNLKNFYYEDITQKVISACKKHYTFVEDIALLYKVVHVSTTHADAMARCKTDGARLLLVESEELFRYFQHFCDESTKYDPNRGTTYWGYWINGKYDNGNWLDGTNKKLANIYWDPAAPLQPYEGTCMAISYTNQDGVWLSNRNCFRAYFFICQIVI